MIIDYSEVRSRCTFKSLGKLFPPPPLLHPDNDDDIDDGDDAEGDEFPFIKF